MTETLQDMEQFILENFDTALAERYIQPYYQPVIRTLSRRMCSFEALARWNDPARGLIVPDQFIGVLEAHRLRHRVGRPAVLPGYAGRVRTLVQHA